VRAARAIRTHWAATPTRESAGRAGGRRRGSSNLGGLSLCAQWPAARRALTECGPNIECGPCTKCGRAPICRRPSGFKAHLRHLEATWSAIAAETERASNFALGCGAPDRIHTLSCWPERRLGPMKARHFSRLGVQFAAERDRPAANRDSLSESCASLAVRLAREAAKSQVELAENRLPRRRRTGGRIHKRPFCAFQQVSGATSSLADLSRLPDSSTRRFIGFVDTKTAA